MNPIDNPDQITAEQDVIALWREDKVRADCQATGHLWKHGWRDAIPDEMRPFVEEHIANFYTQWLFKAAASDGEHPRFVRTFMPPYSWHGHDVPDSRACGESVDNCYRVAGIAHGAQYRVTGRILDRAPANVSLTLVGDYGTTVTIQTIELHQLECASDGSFVITIDDEPGNGRRNHMTTAPHVKFLYVRDSMDDWALETPLELHIEWLGAPKTTPISREEMAHRAFVRAKEDVRLYHWYQCSFVGLRDNSLVMSAFTKGATGGLVTQAVAQGHYRLAQDDAVIYEYDPAGAGYVSVQLVDWLFRQLEPKDRQSMLSKSQSHISGDGRIRVVIARQDPGVANWLDCGGFEETFLMQRWQRIPPSGTPHAQFKIVKLDQLGAELPADTLWFSAQQRAEQIAARKTAYARRITPNA